MPPRTPGNCAVCGTPCIGNLCDDCEALRIKFSKLRLNLPAEPPVDHADTQPIPATEAPRPAQLCPPRREPSWLRGRVVTVECHPSDVKHEQMLAGLGYTQTAEIKDPHTGLVTSHVWAKEIADEGC